MTNNKVNPAFKDIALRYKITEEQIPNIVKSMQLNPEDSPSETQLKGFEEICKLLETGMELGLATQTVKNTIREEKAKKQASEIVPNDQALATQDPAAIHQATLVQFDESVPGDLKEAINQPLDQDAAATVEGLPESIAESVEEVKTPFQVGLDAYVKNRWTEGVTKGLQDPKTLQAISEALQGKRQS
ncbi:MAG TPA: hypothetical protein V6D19_10200, partial [Stenomitos sp.]